MIVVGGVEVLKPPSKAMNINAPTMVYSSTKQDTPTDASNDVAFPLPVLLLAP